MNTNTEARRDAAQQARTVIALQPVYLDTETTGLEASDQIVEICIVDDAGMALVDSLVKPTTRIPVSAIRIHGITDEMVKNAPAWPELWPQVVTALTGRRVAIYNADYDLRLMNQTHRRHRMPWPAINLDSICVMQLYARFHGEWDSYRGSYRWQNLDMAIRQCGIKRPGTPAHRARADVLAAHALLHYMARQASL